MPYQETLVLAQILRLGLSPYHLARLAINGDLPDHPPDPGQIHKL